MDVFMWTIVGSISGFIASNFRKKEEIDRLTDLSLGVLGSLVTGILLNIFGKPGITDLNIYGIFVTFLGAIVLIWIGRALSHA